MNRRNLLKAISAIFILPLAKLADAAKGPQVVNVVAEQKPIGMTYEFVAICRNGRFEPPIDWTNIGEVTTSWTVS